MTNNKKTLIIFYKGFEKGKVKTRLAESLGNEGALEAYKAILGDLSNNLKDSDFSLQPYINKNYNSEYMFWENSEIQNGQDLGARMLNAFKYEFDKGSNKVLLIGTDIPDINKNLIEDYFKNLNACDIVLGPGDDGGYYLIGFNKDSFSEDVFLNIEWSTEKVLTQTLEKINKSGKKIYLGKVLKDIDYLEDLESYFSESKNTQSNLYDFYQNIRR